MVVAKSHNKIQFFSAIVVFMLLIYPVLQTYGYGHYNFAFIIMTVLSVFALFRTGFKSYMPKLLNYYFIFWALSHVLMASSASSLIPIGVIRTYLVFNMLFKEFDFKLCIRLYEILAIIFLVFFFFQEFVYATTEYRILGVSEYLPLALNVEDADAYYQKMMLSERSSSFFSEPAHFVQFLLPLFTIKLFKPTKQYDIVFAGVIFVALLLMQSGNALLGLAAIGGCFIFTRFLHNFNIQKGLLVLLLLAFMAIGANYYLESEMGQNLMERQDQLEDEEGDSQSGSSGFLRIFRGYFVYDAMSPIEKVVGADDTNRLDAAISSSTVSWAFKENDYYFNMAQTLLIRTGIIGTLLFVLFMYSSIRKVDSCGIAILVTLICLSFIAAIHFTVVMALYVLLALSFTRKDERNGIVVHKKK